MGLAQKTIETYIRTREKISVPQGLPEEMYTTQAGAFVSLKENGMLRGCIGTISPICSCVAAEIIQNAISAATRDPRFYPVKASELDTLEEQISIAREKARIRPEETDVVLERFQVVRHQ